MDLQETDYFVNKRVLRNPHNPSWPFKYFSRRLLFSPDGTQLVVWDEYSDKVHVWDIARQEIVAVIDKKHRTDPDFAYVEDGKYLVGTKSVAFGEPHAFVLYETQNYEQVDTWQPTEGKKTLVATPDGKAMAYTSGRKGLRSPVRLTIFDVVNKTIVNQLTDIDGLDTITFSPDGRQLADGTTEYGPGDGIHNNEYHIRIWNYPELDTKLTIEDAHPAEVSSLAYSNDGKRLYSWSGSTDREEYYSQALGKTLDTRAYLEPIKIWNAHTGEKLKEIEGIVGGVYEMHTTKANHGLLLFKIHNKVTSILLLDTHTARIKNKLELDATVNPIAAIALAPEKNAFAIGIDRSIVLFDVRDIRY